MPARKDEEKTENSGTLLYLDGSDTCGIYLVEFYGTMLFSATCLIFQRLGSCNKNNYSRYRLHSDITHPKPQHINKEIKFQNIKSQLKVFQQINWISIVKY